VIRRLSKTELVENRSRLITNLDCQSVSISKESIRFHHAKSHQMQTKNNQHHNKAHNFSFSLKSNKKNHASVARSPTQEDFQGPHLKRR
jgi:hypothetical protein